MLFGDIDSFGIQIEINKDGFDKFMFRQMCFWVKGERVGNYMATASLSDSLISMKWLVHDCGNRRSDVLSMMGPEEIYNFLDGVIYRSHENHDLVEAVEMSARFDLDMQIQATDGWRIFLIDRDDHSLMIYRKNNDREIKREPGSDPTAVFSKAVGWPIKSAIIPLGAFDEAIRGAWEELNRIYDSIGSSGSAVDCVAESSG